MQARSEVYLGVFKKHLCFLPGLPFGVQMGRWSLPQTEMQTLATCVRKLARLLWTLHLTFQEACTPSHLHTCNSNVCQHRPSCYLDKLLSVALYVVVNLWCMAVLRHLGNIFHCLVMPVGGFAHLIALRPINSNVNMQGFDENMMAMLKQQYPARLMPQLVSSSQATLQV